MGTIALVSKNTSSCIKSICKDVLVLIDGVKESKFGSGSKMHELKELMDINECTGTFYFESTRRRQSLWITHIDGPTVRLNIVDLMHMGSFAGNALKECGGVLLFTKDFDAGHLAFFRTVIEKVCTNAKPKDRAICFYFYNNMIWMRCYNIKTMEEIGPRLTLSIEKVLEGCFCGACIYKA